MADDDFIFAPSTAGGLAATQIVRISGAGALAALAAFGVSLPVERRASLRKLINPRDGELLDQALVLWFKAPHSYTGDDVVELHLHGSVAILRAVLEVLDGLPSGRRASRGEFTRRAYENGRLSSGDVIVLSDIIGAQSDAQLRLAWRSFGRDHAQLFAAVREQLIALYAGVEASIDFEEDLSDGEGVEDLAQKLSDLKERIDVFLRAAKAASSLRDGIRVTLVGAPNAGKSTLYNALLGSDEAITSATAGTTRDVKEARISMAGAMVILSDTAGIRQSHDEIENEAISRARRYADGADLVLWVHDAASDAPESDDDTYAYLARLACPVILVCNKCDLPNSKQSKMQPALQPAFPSQTSGFEQSDFAARVLVSGKTGQGLETLRAQIENVIEGMVSTIGDATALRDEQIAALERISDRLSAAKNSISSLELVSHGLHECLAEMTILTSSVDLDEVLDKLFSSFCVGK